MMNNSTRTYLREIQNKLRSSITGEKEFTNESAVIDYAVKALYDLFKKQFPHSTPRSFHSVIGFELETCEFIWNKYFLSQSIFQQIHLLWTFSFLKFYGT